jgi:hypothetical protein
MRTTLLVLALIMGTQALAQDAVFPPQSLLVSQHPQDQFTVAPPDRETKPRIFDRKFLLLAGIATTATVLDLATTSHCISTYSHCQEGNPLVGSNPSTARLYGISLSILGAQLLASAWLRREMPHRKLWMAPPIAASVGHGIAAVLNLRTMRQLQTSTSQ